MAWVIGIGIALTLLFVFPRQMLLLLAVIVALGLIGGGVFWGMNQAEKRRLEATGVSVAYDPVRCSAEYPLLISISNGTGGEIARVSFNVSAHRPGYSGRLYDYGGYYSSDRIIPKGRTYEGCWVLTTRYSKPDAEYLDQYPPAEMVWSANASSVTFSD